MALSYRQIKTALEGRRLPAAFVDLDALDRNLDRVLKQIEPSQIPLRIASKSLRVPEILRRLIDRADGSLKGIMCFATEEAAFLAERGFDDLLVAYPPYQRSDLELAARLTADGTTISIMSDSAEGIQRAGEIGRSLGVELRLVLCVDMSLSVGLNERWGKLHLGVRRSPLRTPEQVVAMARRIADTDGVHFQGLMGYEAQVAGLGDDNPFEPLLNPIKSLIRRASVSELGPRRKAMVDALVAADLPPALVNGGGSGSLDTTTPATGVTEVTAGSAFFKPHLFDYYKAPHMRALEPACFFALEVTRKPAPDMVTCLGGGYVASGAPGRDKVPLPWLPSGLHLLGGEMCGEVQTPLRLDDPSALSLGDPVVLRHAKGGELAERFDHFLLLSKGEVVGSAKTYRGEGQCFF
jgi:D-serine deaminase-like pyridoxal phosphate-dependent protein